jgi:hypothetical protein
MLFSLANCSILVMIFVYFLDSCSGNFVGKIEKCKRAFIIIECRKAVMRRLLKFLIAFRFHTQLKSFTL